MAEWNMLLCTEKKLKYSIIIINNCHKIAFPFENEFVVPVFPVYSDCINFYSKCIKNVPFLLTYILIQLLTSQNSAEY